MPVHLAHPWIVAALALGLSEVVVACVVLGLSLAALRPSSDGSSDARALRAERRADALAPASGALYALAVTSALALVSAAHGLAPSLRGAMCAYGVFASSDRGPQALFAALVALLLGAAADARRAVDARLPRGSLVRRAAPWTALAALAALAQAATSARLLVHLDLDVVTTCCTVALDARSAGRAEVLGVDATRALGFGSFAASLAAAGASLWARRSLTRASVGLSAVTQAAALWAGARALVDVVAPALLEAPEHRCAFCLLRPEAGPLGLVALAALGLAADAWAGAASIAPWRGLGRVAREVTEGELRARFGRASAAWIVWGGVLAAAIARGG